MTGFTLVGFEEGFEGSKSGSIPRGEGLGRCSSHKGQQRRGKAEIVEGPEDLQGVEPVGRSAAECKECRMD